VPRGSATCQVCGGRSGSASLTKPMPPSKAHGCSPAPLPNASNTDLLTWVPEQRESVLNQAPVTSLRSNNVGLVTICLIDGVAHLQDTAGTRASQQPAVKRRESRVSASHILWRRSCSSGTCPTLNHQSSTLAGNVSCHYRHSRLKTTDIHASKPQAFTPKNHPHF
jgi:hypothetical protein